MNITRHRAGVEVIIRVGVSLWTQLPGLLLMITTICFLDDLAAALTEACRVPRSEGSPLIGMIDKESPLGRLYQRRRNASAFHVIATFYAVDEIVTELRRAAFHHLAFAQTIFHPLESFRQADAVKDGCGEGWFVVVRPRK